jgi:hypothetical protein
VYLIPGAAAASQPGVAGGAFLNMINRAASWLTITHNKGIDTG